MHDKWKKGKKFKNKNSKKKMEGVKLWMEAIDTTSVIILLNKLILTFNFNNF